MEPQSLARWTIISGAVVTVIGVVAFLLTMTATALIPAVIGILIVIAGVVARRPGAHRPAMWAAVVIAFLGLAGTLMNVMQLGQLLAGTAERPLAVVASTATFVALAIFLVVGIRGMMRRTQTAQTPRE